LATPVCRGRADARVVAVDAGRTSWPQAQTGGSM
jgi:hypothetical protein